MSFNNSPVTDNDRDLVSEDRRGKLKMEDDKGKEEVVDKLRHSKHEMTSGPPQHSE